MLSLPVDLPAARQPHAKLITAGQPSPDHLAQLAAQGVKAVINLRPTTENAGYDELAVAARLGLHYVVVPTTPNADGITFANAAILDKAIAEAQAAVGDAPMLIHCASSNRVGALLALRASAAGVGKDAAMEVGREAGLVALAPLVEQLL